MTTDPAKYEESANAFVAMLNKISGSLCEWRIEYFNYSPDYPEENRVDYAAYVRDDVWDGVLAALAKIGFDVSEPQENGVKFTLGDTTLYIDSKEKIQWRKVDR